MSRAAVDVVLDTLGASLTAFKFVAATGFLPENKGVKVVMDIVKVVSALIPSVEAQIDRFRDMRDSGVELSPEEWEQIGLDITELEEDLLVMLKTGQPV